MEAGCEGWVVDIASEGEAFGGGEVGQGVGSDEGVAAAGLGQGS